MRILKKPQQYLQPKITTNYEIIICQILIENASLVGELYYVIQGRVDELCSHNFKGIYFVEITLGYVLCEINVFYQHYVQRRPNSD